MEKWKIIETTILDTITLTNIGECDIMIKKDESIMIPHFHIVSKDGTFDTAILIYDNKYLSDKEPKLTDIQAEELDKTLYSSKYGLPANIGVRIIWDGKYGNKNSKDNWPIPNYRLSAQKARASLF